MCKYAKFRDCWHLYKCKMQYKNGITLDNKFSFLESDLICTLTKSLLI